MLLLVPLGSVLLLGRVLRSYAALAGTKRRSRGITLELEGVPSRSRRAAVRISREIATPALAGLWRPMVLLPEGFLERHPEREVRAALLHEQAHLARWDDWTQLAQRLLDAALFFHPGVRALTWGMEFDREQACDAAVLRQTRDWESYCRCLARLAGAAEPSAAISFTGQGRSVLKRLEAMTAMQTKERFGGVYVAMATVATLGAVLSIVGPLVVVTTGTAPLLAQAPLPEPQPAPKPTAPKPAPAASPAAKRPVTKAEQLTLQQALRDLDRDMERVDRAIKEELKKADAALQEMQPALRELEESLRNMKLQVSVHDLHGLTRDEYQSAEAELTERTRRAIERERQEMAADPEAYRKKANFFFQRFALDLAIPKVAVDAALQVIANGGTQKEAMDALNKATLQLRSQQK